MLIFAPADVAVIFIKKYSMDYVRRVYVCMCMQYFCIVMYEKGKTNEASALPIGTSKL